MRAYERLIEYTNYPTGSDDGSSTCPSTPEQLEFGRALVEEMKGLGIKDAAMDRNGYIIGTIEANIPDWSGTVIGFIAHMDVVREVPFANIKTSIVKNYDGNDILLNKEKNIILSPKDYSSLRQYQGMDLLVTDGTTLLGADDKAGLAEIMTMAEELQKNPSIRHGTIKIGFTPDEEIGRGADLFQVKEFGADFAYTVDGAAFGEVEYETFNAAEAVIRVNGISIHPGDAKGKMKNANLIAMEFNSLLPGSERPETTEGYEGFYHLNEMEGMVDHAKLKYILRDHNADKLEARKAAVIAAAAEIKEKYGDEVLEVKLRDQYRNMAEVIKANWHLIDTAYEAVRELGGTPCSEPVRGGTDGSRLSFMGLPCPNLGTGSHNHHGKLEYACIQSMDRVVAMLIKIAEKYARMEPHR